MEIVDEPRYVYKDRKGPSLYDLKLTKHLRVSERQRAKSKTSNANEQPGRDEPSDCAGIGRIESDSDDSIFANDLFREDEKFNQRLVGKKWFAFEEFQN